jgi:predicted metal-dependent hydrolase
MILDGTPVSYTVRRSARAKHMRITVSAHSGVVVTLPARLRRYVNPEELLREKKVWLLQHLQTIAVPPVSSPLRDGSLIHYLGRPVVVRVDHGGSRPVVELEGSQLHLTLPYTFEGELKDLVRSWLREEAGIAVAREAARLAPQIGVSYNRLGIRDQKTKWGSCSRNGNLSFNWRLILFPPRVLRYIVIHELCHLRHFNHSDKFWDLVERHDPQYRDAIAWLKKHGALMEGDLR